jgi:pimeloyl-ACP methyl ester carboxylesterase
MKPIALLLLLWLWMPAKAQDSCRPDYGLPVHYVQLESIRMAYVEKGSGDPILFIHGLGGNAAHWMPLVDRLSASYRCIVVDLPGYGWSDKNLPFDQNLVRYDAAMLYRFARRMKLRKIVVAGHSMGAQIAMTLALDHPKLLRRLVLIAPAGIETFGDDEARMMITATPPAAFAQKEEQAIRPSFALNFYRPGAPMEALIRDRVRFARCADFAQYTQAVSASVKGMLQYPVRSQIGKLGMPVLLIVGAQDALIPNRYLHPKLNGPELMKQAVADIKKGKLVVIEQCGHLVQMEKPDETEQAIRAFIQ